MIFICAGALGAGVVVAPFLPFLPFAASLTLAVLFGIGVSLARGMSVGDTALPALGILVACQVGYGLGQIVTASAENLFRVVRRWRASEAGTPVKRLRPDRK